MLNALSHIPGRALPTKGLQSERVYEAPAIEAIEFGVGTAPLGDRVVAEFELPGQVQLRIALSPRDAKLLGSALRAGADKVKKARNLTKQ
jgi:hypothetical protein